MDHPLHRGIQMALTLDGLLVVEAPHATEVVFEQPPIKPSKHRSARVLKKLKSRPGWYIHRPAAYRMGNKLFIHPTLLLELRRKLATNKASLYEPSMENAR